MRDPIFSSPLMSRRTARRLIRMERESNCLVGICSIIHIFFKLAASLTIEGHSHSGLGSWDSPSCNEWTLHISR